MHLPLGSRCMCGASARAGCAWKRRRMIRKPTVPQVPPCDAVTVRLNSPSRANGRTGSKTGRSRGDPRCHGLGLRRLGAPSSRTRMTIPDQMAAPNEIPPESGQPTGESDLRGDGARISRCIQPQDCCLAPARVVVPIAFRLSCSYPYLSRIRGSRNAYVMSTAKFESTRKNAYSKMVPITTG